MEKSKWSDVDYVRKYIEEKKYTPKTDMENLINMVLIHYEGELQDSDKDFYGVEDDREYPQSLMINIKDLDVYVNDNGGLEEFDYYS